MLRPYANITITLSITIYGDNGTHNVRTTKQ